MTDIQTIARYRAGSKAYGGGFQKPSSTLPQSIRNVFDKHYYGPKTLGPRDSSKPFQGNKGSRPPLTDTQIRNMLRQSSFGVRGGTGALLKVAGKAALKFIPFLGIILSAYEFYNLIEKLRSPTGSFGDYYNMQGGILQCGRQGSVMVGHLSDIPCGGGNVHLKSSQNEWRLSGSFWKIISGPDITWNLDPAYFDFRPGKIIGQWFIPGAEPQPDDVILIPRKPVYADPYADPGPAPWPWGDPRPLPKVKPDVKTKEDDKPEWKRPRFPNPSIDPAIYPPGYRPPPRHLPLWKVARNPRPKNTNPFRVEAEPRIQPPNQVPIDKPTVIFNPGFPTRVSKKPHLLARPAPKTKEVKLKGVIQAGSLTAKALNTVTEGLDALYCFYDGIPKKYRESSKKYGGSGFYHKRCYQKRGSGRAKGKETLVGKGSRTVCFWTKDIKRPPPGEAGSRIMDAFEGETGEDMVQMLGKISNCLIANHIEDAIIGTTAQKASKQAGKAFQKYLPGSSRARAPLLGFVNLGKV